MTAPAAPTLPATVWVTGVTRVGEGVCLDSSADREASDAGTQVWNGDVGGLNGWSRRSEPAEYIRADVADARIAKLRAALEDIKGTTRGQDYGPYVGPEASRAWDYAHDALEADDAAKEVTRG